MSRIIIEVTNEIPKPQPRPRGGKYGTYNPKSANKWRAAVEAACKLAQINWPLSIDCGILAPLWRTAIIVCRIPRPAAHFGTGKNSAILKDENSKSPAPEHPITKNVGDIDNLLKSTLDAMERSGIIHNDAQVCVAVGSKKYAKPGGTPGGTITLDTGVYEYGLFSSEPIDVEETGI